MKFIYTFAVLSPILASAAFVMELTLVPIVLPLLQTELELTVQELARFYNVYGIAVAIAVLLGGYLGDTLGLLAVYIVGILLFIAGGVILTIAASELTFIMGRIVQGFGGGLFSPIVPVLLTSILSERPGKILIIWGSVAGIIAAFAPILGGPLIAQYGWKTAFYIIAGLSVISLFTLQQKYLQNSKVETFLFSDYRDLFSLQNIWLVYGYIFLTYGCIILFTFLLPLQLSHYGRTAIETGWIFAVLWLSFSGFSVILRNKIDGPHLRHVLLAAPVLIACSFLLLSEVDQFEMLILATVALGAGFACANAPSTTLVLRFAPTGTKGLASSVDITCARLGAVSTVGLMAAFSMSHIVLVVCALCALAFLCGLLYREALPELEA